MKLYEFVEAYNLHDSFIETIEYNEEEKIITAVIHFAFWMQNNYVAGTPETGLIKVMFTGVKKYICENGDPAGSFVGILGSKIIDEDLVINFVDDESVEYFEMKVSADDVTVEVVEAQD